ncbi:hypothetical protein AAF712_015296 [Marasmius tenuissimus]|uniref:F-box domain-containing protein n=1 Tax=Marasmius tenuissimus TaxID=585030 RepID=A0ABR2Z8X3_9AGAR
MYQIHIHQLEVHKGEQATLRRNISYYLSVSSSPIRQLPPEILHDIFLFAATSEWNTFGVGGSRAHPCIQAGPPTGTWKSTAFALSSVCTLWRAIALNSPQLWSRIAVRVCQRSLEPTRLCTLRSGNHPLSVYIEDYLVDRHTESIDHLLRHRNRWADINVENAGTRIPVGLGQYSALPMIKSAVYCGWHQRAKILQRHLAGSKTLESLTLGFPDAGDGPPYSYYQALPLDRLRHLTARRWGNQAVRKFVDVLMRCHSLESFTYTNDSDVIGGGMADWESDSNTYISSVWRTGELVEPVVSPAETMTVNLHNRAGIYVELGDLFSCLTLPRLTSLNIRGSCNPTEGYADEWPRAKVEMFLSRSGSGNSSTLTKLSLEGMPLRDFQVLTLLRLTPALEDLTIREMWTSLTFHSPADSRKLVQTLTRMFMQELRSPGSNNDAFASSHPVVPRLKRMVLRVQAHFDADELFVDMVKSRWFIPVWSKQLREVELHVLGRALNAKTYETLKYLDKAGMMITVLGNGQHVV